MSTPTLDSSRDLRIHLRAWDDGQAALCRTLLSVAPFVDHAGLVSLIKNLLGEPSQTSTEVDDLPDASLSTPPAHSGSASHGHFFGWSERHGAETFEHEHERGDEPHEHVLRDGGTEVKRTTWGPTRAADVPGQS